MKSNPASYKKYRKGLCSPFLEQFKFDSSPSAAWIVSVLLAK